MITSTANQSVKDVIQLNQKSRARQREGLFVAEGVKMFEEAPEDRICKVFVAQRAEAELYGRYGGRLSRLHTEIVADPVFDRMADTRSPQGILCLVRQREYRLEQLLDAGGGAPLLVIIEDLQDPGNLGTIFRTGEGAGVSGIIMSCGTVDIYNPKTIRSTMGSIYRVPFLYTDDLTAAAALLRERGVGVYAAHLGGSRMYDACDYKAGTAFLIGNEGNGLREETARCADCLVRIPMEGKLESLNASVAASLLLYEAYRQRRG